MDHQHAVETHAAERYLLNELGDADRDAFEAHYFDCVICADDVRTGARMREGVGAGMLDAGARSANVVSIESRRRPTITAMAPWAIAATLALVAGYQAMVVVPGLRQQEAGAYAVVPVLLKPASRGAITSVTLSGTGVIAFSLDLNAAADPGAALTYDLRTVDGAAVAAGIVAAPPTGTPLFLVVPETRFARPGSYVLTVSGSGGTTPVAEYRFAVRQP